MVIIFCFEDGKFSTKYFEPKIPCSSALNPTKIIDLFSLSLLRESLLANSNIPATPDALSSAPL